MSDSVGSVSVDVVPDARGWAEKLRAQIRDVTATVNMDTTEANAKLDEVIAKEDDAARTRRGRVVIDSSSTRTAVGRLDSFLGKIGTLPAIALAAGSALIPLAGALGGIVATLGAPLAIVGAGGTLYAFLAGAAVKQTETQKKKIDQLQKAVESARQTLANTEASAQSSAARSTATAQASARASLLSAQQSAAASIASARRAEATATTAAGRAAARQRLLAAQQSLAQRRDAVAASLSSRQSSITAGQSASVAAAQRKVNQAVAAYRAELKGLSPDQKRFLDDQSKLKASFQNFIAEAGPDVLGPAAKFLVLLTTLLPIARPIVHAVAGDLDSMIASIDKGAQSPGFHAFVTLFAHQLGADLLSTEHIIGHLVGGLASLFLLVDRHSGSRGMLGDLDHLTATFQQWAGSREARHDVEGFMEYFHRVGPQVADTIGAVARAGGHLVHALAPLGPPVLRVVEGIANALSGIPVPVLTGLAGAFAAMLAFQKVGGLKLAGKLPAAAGIGRNVLSELTGGLISPSSKYGKGVTPVYVTNPGFGGGSGGGGFLSKTGKFLEKNVGGITVGGAALTYGGVAGIAGVVTIAAASAFGLWKTWQAESQPGRVNPGGLTPTQWAAFNRQRLNANTGGVGSEDNAAIASVAGRADALRANLASASRQIDMIGPHADTAFGQASRDVAHLSLRLAELHDPVLKARLDDTQAIHRLEDLNAFRLHDKTITARVELEIERALGPGGGMNRPVGPTYTGPITVNAHDHADFQRQMQQRSRQRSLDGVGSG